jgi:hypothetical protein
MFQAVADSMKADGTSLDFAVVDESQDLTVTQTRFFAALGGARPNALFFSGDLGQRIVQQPFSWKAQGVDGHAAPLHSCKYRRLRAPATNCPL